MPLNRHVGTRVLRSVSLGAALAACSLQAMGADTYSAGQLTIPSLTIGNATYSEVVVGISAVLGGPAGASPVGSADSYNPLTGQLTVPAVTLGSTTVYNALATVGKLTSIGAVSGADTYDGSRLTVPYVQVNGGTIYTNVVARVGHIVSAIGGMPAGPWDSYSTQSGELTIPAVTYGGKVYTNVTVTIAGILSFGGGGTAQSISFPQPSNSNPDLAIGTWGALSATASSGLPVSYYVTTPSICGVYNSTPQEQYIYFSYSATGEAGAGVMGGVPVATDVFQANTLVGTVTMVNGQATSAPMGLLSQLTPYTGTSPPPVPPYTNYVSGIWIFDDVLFANGSPLWDEAGFAFQIPGDSINLGYAGGYYYADNFDAASGGEGLPNAYAFLGNPGNAVIGLTQGACQITAFQSGNGTYASRRRSRSRSIPEKSSCRSPRGRPGTGAFGYHRGMVERDTDFKRHSVVTRVTHWVNVAAMTGLLMSGLRILGAHPWLYWGEASGRAWLHIANHGGNMAFPGWLTNPELPGPRDRAPLALPVRVDTGRQRPRVPLCGAADAAPVAGPDPVAGRARAAPPRHRAVASPEVPVPARRGGSAITTRCRRSRTPGPRARARSRW